MGGSRSAEERWRFFAWLWHTQNGVLDCFKFFGEFGDTLVNIADDTVVGHFKNWGGLVLMNGHNNLSITHADGMLNLAGDT